jgi:hypothetical protein
MKRINEGKSWFFEKISETNKLLANLTKKKDPINKIIEEKVDNTTNANEIQKIMRE